MQLTFRGQSYTVATPSLNIIESQEQGTFRGCTSILKQSHTNQTEQPAAELTYRGIRYTPGTPRPGEQMINSRLTRQIHRSRAGRRLSPAFRSSYSR